jgi:hypothetical protein
MSLSDMYWDWRLKTKQRQMIAVLMAQGAPEGVAKEITELTMKVVADYQSKGIDAPKRMLDRLSMLAAQLPET